MYDAMLNNWRLERTFGGNYCLIGDIYFDSKKRFKDGLTVRTSSIKSIDFDNELAVTKNTTYKLNKED
jgi:hypothetical protein